MAQFLTFEGDIYEMSIKLGTTSYSFYLALLRIVCWWDHYQLVGFLPASRWVSIVPNWWLGNIHRFVLTGCRMICSIGGELTSIWQIRVIGKTRTVSLCSLCFELNAERAGSWTYSANKWSILFDCLVISLQFSSK